MCNSNFGLVSGWNPRSVSVLGQLSKPVRATSIVGVKPQTALITWGEILENSLKSQRRDTFNIQLGGTLPSCTIAVTTHYQQCLPQIGTPRFGQNMPCHYYPIT